MSKKQNGYQLDEVRKAIATSTSWYGALVKLGRSPRGRTDKALKRFVKEHSIDTSHFTGRANAPSRRLTDEEYFVDGVYRSTSTLKTRVIQTGRVPYCCAICNTEPTWRDKEIVLWLDHIDGNPKNNRLENFQFACPNCASQLQTHGSKRKRANQDSGTKIVSGMAKAYDQSNYAVPPNSRIIKKEYLVVGTNTVSREELSKIISDSMSLSDVARACGGKPTPSNVRKMGRYAAAWGLSIEHFDPYHPGQLHNKTTKDKLLAKLTKDSTTSSHSLKHWLWNLGMLPRQCQECRIGEEWNGSHLSLHLDHINGEHTDNRLENLRILCPNCHSQTDTFSGGARRKKAKENASRKCQHCNKDFMSFSRIYCSDECMRAGFTKKVSGVRRGEARPEFRKVERPPLEEVQAYVDQHGYLAAGREWGVSDNAIRKWLRNGIQ